MDKGSASDRAGRTGRPARAVSNDAAGPGGPDRTTTSGDNSRRRFLGRLAVICGGAIAFFTAGLTLTTFISPVFGRKADDWIKVGPVDPELGDYPRSVPFSIRRNDGWLTTNFEGLIHLIRDESGNVIALSSVCTHLGCRTRWDKAREKFLCPCHGGVYDASGAVVAGPPPRPLHRLQTRFENGVLFVRGEDLGV